jgi:hypothetical protein
MHVKKWAVEIRVKDWITERKLKHNCDEIMVTWGRLNSICWKRGDCLKNIFVLLCDDLLLLYKLTKKRTLFALFRTSCAVQMRPSLFWDVTQRKSFPRFRDNLSVPFQKTAWPMKMGLIRCPETSATNTNSHRLTFQKSEDPRTLYVDILTVGLYFG